MSIDYTAAVAEEARSHDDVIDQRELGSAKGPRIVTHHDPKPVPTRAFDWSATTDNYDASYEGPEDGWVANDPVGYGATEAAAIADLQDQLEEVAPVTDETLHEDRDHRSERERLMDECGMSARDFF